MSARKGKAVVLGTAAAALAVLGATALILWPLAVEAWWLRELASADASVKIHAAQRLGEIRSRKAVPGLMKTAEEGLRKMAPRLDARTAAFNGPRDHAKSVEVVALQALARIGEPAVTALLESFGSWSLESWWGFVLAMPDLGEDARSFVPVLEAILRSDRSLPTHRAFQVLVSLQTNVEEEVRFLLAGLREEDDSIASFAATCLQNLGPKGRPAVPLVIGAAKDSSRRVRAAAIGALLGLGANPGDVVPVFIDALDDPVSAVREKAIEQLGEMGPAASGAVPALKRALSGKSPPEAHLAARALKKIRT